MKILAAIGVSLCIIVLIIGVFVIADLIDDRCHCLNSQVQGTTEGIQAIGRGENAGIVLAGFASAIAGCALFLGMASWWIKWKKEKDWREENG